jgi:hypothetical protein
MLEKMEISGALEHSLYCDKHQTQTLSNTCLQVDLRDHLHCKTAAAAAFIMHYSRCEQIDSRNKRHTLFLGYHMCFVHSGV